MCKYTKHIQTNKFFFFVVRRNPAPLEKHLPVLFAWKTSKRFGSWRQTTQPDIKKPRPFGRGYIPYYNYLSSPAERAAHVQ